MNVRTLVAGAKVLVAVTVLAACAPSDASAFRPGRCAALTGLEVPAVTITSARAIKNGQFQVTDEPSFEKDGVLPTQISDLPPFCRVTGVIRPQIAFETWLPLDAWNGKLYGVGQGAWAGKFIYRAFPPAGAPVGLVDAIEHGYAAAATDQGHAQSRDTNDATWVSGHPERIESYGYRAIHEMTVAAKAIIREAYGRGPEFSYFAGCSGGGRAALVEAQRFPGDYDGIIATAPANPMNAVLARLLRDRQIFLDPARRLRDEQVEVLQAAVIKACDASDGLADGLVTDQMHCSFDPAQLQCVDGERDGCLSDEQVAALATLYEPWTASDGSVLMPGQLPGLDYADSGRWDVLTAADPAEFNLEFWRRWVFEDPDWDWEAADMNAALERANERYAKLVDATPDLRRFAERGGKIIIIHGTSDTGIPPRNTLEYYRNAVIAATGKQAAVDETPAASDFARFFLVPGFGHCDGGRGPHDFDQLDVISRWVEQGTPPSQLTVTGESPTSGIRSRPVCPYPEIAKYAGTGDIDEAGSFRCE